MSYSLDEIKMVIDAVETKKIIAELSLVEKDEEFARETHTLLEKTESYLGILGLTITGISCGVITLILNYLIFVWLFHLEF